MSSKFIDRKEIKKTLEKGNEVLDHYFDELDKYIEDLVINQRLYDFTKTLVEVSKENELIESREKTVKKNNVVKKEKEKEKIKEEKLDLKFIFNKIFTCQEANEELNYEIWEPYLEMEIHETVLKILIQCTDADEKKKEKLLNELSEIFITLITNPDLTPAEDELLLIYSGLMAEALTVYLQNKHSKIYSEYEKVQICKQVDHLFIGIERDTTHHLYWQLEKIQPVVYLTKKELIKKSPVEEEKKTQLEEIIELLDKVEKHRLKHVNKSKFSAGEEIPAWLPPSPKPVVLDDRLRPKLRKRFDLNGHSGLMQRYIEKHELEKYQKKHYCYMTVIDYEALIKMPYRKTIQSVIKHSKSQFDSQKKRFEDEKRQLSKVFKKEKQKQRQELLDLEIRKTKTLSKRIEIRELCDQIYLSQSY